MNKKKNNVKVCVRCRPLSAAEQYSKMCTKVVGESISIGNKDFRFDGIYNENSSQEKVFVDCVSSLIDGCFEGYNATLFAYGQTGLLNVFSFTFFSVIFIFRIWENAFCRWYSAM